MIESNIRYISNREGNVSDVIVPVKIFKKMIEDLEDKELLRMMKRVEQKSDDYFNQEESFHLIDSLIENSGIQNK